MISFGEWVRRTRRAKKITQVYIAVKAGIDLGALQDIELGRRSPKLFMAECITQTLGYELWEALRACKDTPK